ncbi:salivary endonuclease-like [Haematobia irritans]|uniref:salivary endonuclease-like n=1 Tax=Haematobia irritans TaxID=7368 RepID=UPI003F506C17
MTPLENVEPCRLKDGQMYDIRYNLPIGRTSISLYQVCYNKAREEAVYSHHLVYGSTIAASTYQRPQFVTGNVVDQARANSFEAANVYNAFVGLLGPNQEYVKSTSQSDRIIDRGHLANSQDFLTYDQMDETFKYINVIPQFASINRSNWKRLENWVHNLPQGMQYAEVITGTYGVLELEHSQSKKMTPMFQPLLSLAPINKPNAFLIMISYFTRVCKPLIMSTLLKKRKSHNECGQCCKICENRTIYVCKSNGATNMGPMKMSPTVSNENEPQ